MATLEAVRAAHPGKTPQLWCGDGEAPEALSWEGQKGRTGHRGAKLRFRLVHPRRRANRQAILQRPPGRRDRRFLLTYVFAAVRPGHDDAFALVLPEARS